MAYTPQNSNGQATMANSAPVVLASNQNAIAVTGPVTDGQLRATPVPVTMSNTLALTDTQIRATPLAVSGTFFQATQPVSGSVIQIANGLISTANSTAALLGIGGVFTGPAEDTTDYADIRITVFADQPSATDGLQIQQSSNGTVWDLSDNYTLPAVTGRPFSVPASARFFRIVYINGATAQTAFRLQVKFYKGYTKGASVRPQDGRSRENDMEEMLAYAMHFDGTNWNMTRGTVANGVLTDVSRIQTTVSVAGTRTNNGTSAVVGSFHLTVGGSDGTNLRPMSTDTTGRLNVNSNATLGAETTKVIGTVNVSAGQTIGVTGPFFQATQPVSAASLPLPAGAATETTLAALNTKVTAVNTGAVVLATGAATIGAVTGPAAAPLALDATLANHTQRLQAVTSLTTVSVANTAVTLTLPAVAAQFHYITRIRISMHNTSAAAVVGSAVTLSFSSTNLPGALAWTEGNALAAGISKVVVDEILENAIKSTTANTASTIVAPATGAGVLVRITAYYYTAA